MKLSLVGVRDVCSERSKKVCLQTVGCRLNQYETEKMAAQLSALGLQRVGSLVLTAMWTS